MIFIKKFAMPSKVSKFEINLCGGCYANSSVKFGLNSYFCKKISMRISHINLETSGIVLTTTVYILD